MTYGKLRSVARRKGFVRWLQSGMVERLRLIRDQKLLVIAEVMDANKRKVPFVILAKNLITGKEHPVKPFTNQTEFDCVEINPSTPVRVGDLLPKGW